MPAPPIIVSGHLSLPTYQVGTPTRHDTGLLSSGFEFIYNTGTLQARAKPWSGFGVKSTDAGLVPVLYTAGLLSALRQPAPGDPNNNTVIKDSVPTFGKQSTLIRLPRVVSFPDTATSSATWATTNQAWLAANHIAVIQLEASVSSLGALESGLPLTGITLVNESAFLGDYAVGVCDPTTFVAGQIFEFRKWFRDYSDNGNAGFLHPKQAAADVATNQAIYPRFAKRRVVSFGPYDGSANDNALLNFQQGFLNQLTSYGFGGSITNTLSMGEQAFYDAQTAAVKAFFGVSP